jgi:UDP-N-acetylmuramate dehydrogenase
MGIRGLELREVDHSQVDVIAGAGENWHELVCWSLAQGLYGLENLSLIPGSVGAAPVQNVGAYGAELAEFFVELSALDTHTGDIVVMDRASCEFSYRDSLFKSSGTERRRFVIAGVTLRLSRQAAPRTDYPDIQRELQQLGIDDASPEQVAKAVIRVRRRKLPDPAVTPNVGSFFKNPQLDRPQAERVRRDFPQLNQYATAQGSKLSAAQLIDLCGWKTRETGPVRVWQRQPLVLVNPERCDGRTVLKLAEAIREDVATRFGIRLEIEPDTVGFD